MRKTKSVFGNMLSKEQKKTLLRIIRQLAREEASILLDEHLADYKHEEVKAT